MNPIVFEPLTNLKPIQVYRYLSSNFVTLRLIWKEAQSVDHSKNGVLVETFAKTLYKYKDLWVSIVVATYPSKKTNYAPLFHKRLVERLQEEAGKKKNIVTALTFLNTFRDTLSNDYVQWNKFNANTWMFLRILLYQAITSWVCHIESDKKSNLGKELDFAPNQLKSWLSSNDFSLHCFVTDVMREKNFDSAKIYMGKPVLDENDTEYVHSFVEFSAHMWMVLTGEDDMICFFCGKTIEINDKYFEITCSNTEKTPHRIRIHGKCFQTKLKTLKFVPVECTKCKAPVNLIQTKLANKVLKTDFDASISNTAEFEFDDNDDDDDDVVTIEESKKKSVQVDAKKLLRSSFKEFVKTNPIPDALTPHKIDTLFNILDSAVDEFQRKQKSSVPKAGNDKAESAFDHINNNNNDSNNTDEAKTKTIQTHPLFDNFRKQAFEDYFNEHVHYQSDDGDEEEDEDKEQQPKNTPNKQKQLKFEPKSYVLQLLRAEPVQQSLKRYFSPAVEIKCDAASAADDNPVVMIRGPEKEMQYAVQFMYDLKLTEKEQTQAKASENVIQSELITVFRQWGIPHEFPGFGVVVTTHHMYADGHSKCRSVYFTEDKHWIYCLFKTYQEGNSLNRLQMLQKVYNAKIEYKGNFADKIVIRGAPAAVKKTENLLFTIWNEILGSGDYSSSIQYLESMFPKETPTTMVVEKEEEEPQIFDTSASSSVAQQEQEQVSHGEIFDTSVESEEGQMVSNKIDFELETEPEPETKIEVKATILPNKKPTPKIPNTKATEHVIGIPYHNCIPRHIFGREGSKITQLEKCYQVRISCLDRNLNANVRRFKISGTGENVDNALVFFNQAAKMVRNRVADRKLDEFFDNYQHPNLATICSKPKNTKATIVVEREKEKKSPVPPPPSTIVIEYAAWTRFQEFPPMSASSSSIAGPD